MKVSAQYAKAHFPDLIEAVSNGIEVEIAIPDKPTVKPIVADPPARPKPTDRRILGGGVGLVKVPAYDDSTAGSYLGQLTPRRSRLCH